MSGEHDARDYIAWRDLPDGRHLDVMPLLFGARLAVSPDAEHNDIESIYDYGTAMAAVRAMHAYDGTAEPQGWSRARTPSEPRGFRRRTDPDDPNSEQVRP